jgi:hypothetical protein
MEVLAGEGRIAGCQKRLKYCDPPMPRDPAEVGAHTFVHRKLPWRVGIFYQPRLVLADVQTPRILPEHEYASGLAEVVKHAIF